jgi:hypothetical protein
MTQLLREMCISSLNDTSSRKSTERRTKGQPEGSAVTGKTGKPRVAKTDLVSEIATGQNNRNLTPKAASVEKWWKRPKVLN